jgi:C4-dicarboxylate transporter, DctQ subunit
MLSNIKLSLRIFDRFIHYIEIFLAIISAFLILGMMVTIVVTIVGRYLSLFPTVWIIEVNEYMLLVLTFLVAPWVLRNDAHIRFDIIVDISPLKIKRLLFYFGNFICFVVMVALTHYGLRITNNFLERNVTMINYWRLPKAPFMAVIPLSASLMAYEFLRNIVVGFDSDSANLEDLKGVL